VVGGSHGWAVRLRWLVVWSSVVVVIGLGLGHGVGGPPTWGSTGRGMPVGRAVWSFNGSRTGEFGPGLVFHGRRCRFLLHLWGAVVVWVMGGWCWDVEGLLW